MCSQFDIPSPELIVFLSFVVVSLLSTRHQTPVCKRTLQPTYAAKDATFDFPLYLSLAEKLGALEFVVWDKDMLKKDYLGEISLPLDDWFVDRGSDDGVRPFAFEDAKNKVCHFQQSMGNKSSSSKSLIAVFINAAVNQGEHCRDWLSRNQIRLHKCSQHGGSPRIW